MKNYRLSELLDMSVLQKLAESHYRATGMPIGIIDALDGSILVGAGWQDICTKFHRANPLSCERCRESDNYIKGRLVEGEACRYKCENGMWDIGMPIIVAGLHLATMFLGQFFYEGETPEREFFVRQAREFGYDLEGYLAALDRVPAFSSDTVDMILAYDKALVRFIADLAERSLQKSEAEKAMLAANERFRSVLRAATAYSIISTDPDGIIKMFNEGAEQMLGYRAEEVVDKATPEIMHDPKQIAARAAEMGVKPGLEVFVSAARQGKTETREWTYVRKDGSPLTVSLTVTAMRSETGVLTGFIGMARDITAEKKMEQQIMQSQKMESVGLLAGGVAHDFNNLLVPILGYADLLVLGFPEKDHRRMQLLQIKEAAARAKDLTQRLLAFSRKQLIELQTTDLGDIIRKFETMLRRTIRENINIEVRIFPDHGLVRADKGQIEQVLLNLSINAQDAMPDGGTLLIETQDIDLDESYTAQHPDISPGRYVVLSVSDTGVGMDGQALEHLFEPFYTTKESGRGTGLGLSTVYGIVKQHGGSISVYSEKGRGSIFKVFLPKVVEPGAAIEHPQPLPEEVMRGVETILVVEDNEMVRKLASDMLNNLGYQVLAAESPERGIEQVKKHQGTINLLLTDVVMPGMNGVELFNTLHHMRPDLKVLFMSGYASNVIGQQGVLEEGVNFIQKPFSFKTLSHKVRQALDA